MCPWPALLENTLDTGAGPADWFTGSVYIGTVTSPSDDWQIGAAAVHFTPGARRQPVLRP
jgi:hypothetical protein